MQEQSSGGRKILSRWPRSHPALFPCALFSFLSFSGSATQSNIKLKLNTAGVSSTSQPSHTQSISTHHSSRAAFFLFFLPISRLAAAPTPKPSCFSAGIFPGFPPGTFCGFPAIPTCSFHKPKGCCKCHEIREFRHQRERKAGAFHSLNS